MAANLDLTDKLVKRGLLVSWHGYRGRVLRVRTGRCLVSWVATSPAHGAGEQGWLECSWVQVVKP